MKEVSPRLRWGASGAVNPHRLHPHKREFLANSVSTTKQEMEEAMTLENIWVRISVERIALFSDVAAKDVFVQDEIAGYRLVEALDPEDGNDDEISHNLQLHKKYRLLLLFADMKTSNRLKIYTQRCKKAQSIPAVYLIFDSSYYNPLKYQDVLFVQNHLERKHNLRFAVSEVHHATDLVTPTDTVLLHGEICMSIRAGKEDNPSRADDDGTLIFGSPRSVIQLIVYDKAEQLLRTEGIKLSEGVSRIETRLRCGGGAEPPPTLDSVRGWSWLYGEYFAFHKPRSRLREVLGEAVLRHPIWELRDLMSKKHRVTTSEFYGKYLIDQPILSDPVRKALAAHRWGKE